VRFYAVDDCGKVWWLGGKVRSAEDFPKALAEGRLFWVEETGAGAVKVRELVRKAG
jgi:hypothetical protein